MKQLAAASVLMAFTTLLFANPSVNEFATAKELGLMEGFPPAADKRVDKSNAIVTPPFNRWSYLHMRNVYPTAKVENAKVASKINKKIDNSIDNLLISNPETNEKVSMDDYLEQAYTDSFVVIKGGKVVYENYLNGMTPDQPHQMMSVTKSFAGLLGLMAVEDGLVSEDDKIATLVPELENASAFNDATFRQMLNMTNSMAFSEVESDPDSDYFLYIAILGLGNKQEGKVYAANMYDFLEGVSKEKGLEHGSEFRYQTPKTDVLNWATNKVTNKSFQTNLTERIWGKIGTDGDTYVLLDPAGTLIAGGGLNTSPKNLTRFAMMMLNDGKNIKGEQVVSEPIIEDIAAGGNIDAFSNGPMSSGIMADKDWSYRAQFWVRHTKGKEAFSAIGVNGQWIYMNKNKDIAIIRQSSQPVSSSAFFDGFNLNAFDTIIEHLSK
ncbi:MAG: serine hydrolase [Pseudomonadota bacterium]|nr:serine hydrolase [Pseudomonadota bacterium]